MSAFSRTGFTGIVGKLTVPVAYKLPEETVEIIDAEAAKAGITRHEFLRDLAIIRAHGKEVVASLHVKRVTVVAGSVEER